MPNRLGILFLVSVLVALGPLIIQAAPHAEVVPPHPSVEEWHTSESTRAEHPGGSHEEVVSLRDYEERAHIVERKSFWKGLFSRSEKWVPDEALSQIEEAYYTPSGWVDSGQLWAIRKRVGESSESRLRVDAAPQGRIVHPTKTRALEIVAIVPTSAMAFENVFEGPSRETALLKMAAMAGRFRELGSTVCSDEANAARKLLDMVASSSARQILIVGHSVGPKDARSIKLPDGSLLDYHKLYATARDSGAECLLVTCYSPDFNTGKIDLNDAYEICQRVARVYPGGDVLPSRVLAHLIADARFDLNATGVTVTWPEPHVKPGYQTLEVWSSRLIGRKRAPASSYPVGVLASALMVVYFIQRVASRWEVHQKCGVFKPRWVRGSQVHNLGQFLARFFYLPVSMFATLSVGGGVFMPISVFDHRFQSGMWNREMLLNILIIEAAAIVSLGLARWIDVQVQLSTQEWQPRFDLRRYVRKYCIFVAIPFCIIAFLTGALSSAVTGLAIVTELTVCLVVIGFLEGYYWSYLAAP